MKEKKKKSPVVEVVSQDKMGQTVQPVLPELVSNVIQLPPQEPIQPITIPVTQPIQIPEQISISNINNGAVSLYGSNASGNPSNSTIAQDGSTVSETLTTNTTSTAGSNTTASLLTTEPEDQKGNTEVCDNDTGQPAATTE